MSFVYLASPYTSIDKAVMERRYVAALKHTGHFMRKNHRVYSPIVHNHPLANHFDLPRSFDFWQVQNFAILAKASEMWVLMLDGWKDSIGIREEKAFADSCGIHVHHITPLEEYL